MINDENIDEPILISMLSEYYYCKRRCSLRLLENASGENDYIVEGTIEHEKVHKIKMEKRKDFIKTFDMRVFSNKYNLLGRCDCVEYKVNNNGTYIDFLNKKCQIVPVEYKHGIVRNEEEYNIQLVAQIMCLEEMYNCTIPYGIIYYVDDNFRQVVNVTDDLCGKVLSGVQNIIRIINNKIMYEPEYKRSCKKCSLYEQCHPEKINTKTFTNEMWKEFEL